MAQAIKRTAAMAAATLDIAARLRTPLRKTFGPWRSRQTFACFIANQPGAMRRSRSRVFLIAIFAALVVMIGFIAWAYIVAENKVR